MIALEVALERPDRVDHVVPIAAPAATGSMAIAWNHIQLELVDRLGDEGLALARQLAMTTYRSEIDFDGRFGRAREPDGRFSINSYLDHQGDKLVDRFDRDTYRTLVRVMDGHDVGRGRGGIEAAFAALAAAGVGLTGLGIQGDILYGPAQVQELVAAARSAGVRRHVPRAALDQGPRRVPDRVGPADPDPRRRARGREAPARPSAAARGRRGGDRRSRLTAQGGRLPSRSPSTVSWSLAQAVRRHLEGTQAPRGHADGRLASPRAGAS